MRPQTLLIGALAGACLTAGALVVAPITPAGATAVPACTSTRLTDVPEEAELTQLDLSGDGSTAAFASRGDLGFDGSANAEVYVVDTTTGVISPVTQVAGSSLDSSRPDLDFDGDTLALLSEAPLAGANADGNAEVLRGLRNGGTWTFDRITTTPTSNDNRAPVISSDGGTIGYQSRTVDATTNPDGNYEVFRWGSGTSNQVTTTTDTGGVFANGDDLSISADGEQMVWTTRSLQANGASTTTSRLIYARGNTRQQIQVAPAGDLDLYRPSAGRDRNVLAFESDESLGATVDGENEDLNQEVWRWTQRQVGGIKTEPITSQPAQANDTSGSVSTNERGTAMAFETNAPGLTGQNVSVPSVVRWAQTGGFTVIEQAWDGSSQPAASAIGHVVAYIGVDDGPGGDGSTDVFVARCRTFSDVPQDHQFWEEVEWAAAELITTGYDDGTYRPAAPVTRAAMAAFMYRLTDPDDLLADPDPEFSDVGAAHPFYEEIEWMAQQGVIAGYSDGTFRPGAPVTRQSMAAFVHRLASSPTGPFPNPGFSDVSAAHPFADEIWWMADEGIADGYSDGTYRPATNVSRQAMSAFLRRFSEGPGLGAS